MASAKGIPPLQCNYKEGAMLCCSSKSFCVLDPGKVDWGKVVTWDGHCMIARFWQMSNLNAFV